MCKKGYLKKENLCKRKMRKMLNFKKGTRNKTLKKH